MKGQFYKEKRHKLLEKVKDNSVVVLFAGKHQRKLPMKLIHLHQIEIFII